MSQPSQSELGRRTKCHGDTGVCAGPGCEARRVCPMQRLHTRCPEGYVAWHEWADKKARRHYQVKCPGCGLFAIWRRKPKEIPE